MSLKRARPFRCYRLWHTSRESPAWWARWAIEASSLSAPANLPSRTGRVGRLHKAQVEQAGFAVLKAPDVPSILIETAFISNPEEEAQLRSAAYREKLVEALAAGIQRYFARNPPLARQRQL